MMMQALLAAPMVQADPVIGSSSAAANFASFQQDS
jgi:hypothetical protein